MIAVRTPASALKAQYWHASARLTEYTIPVSTPIKTRPPDDAGLAQHRSDARESERPFELQPGDIGGRDLRGLGRLKA